MLFRSSVVVCSSQPSVSDRIRWLVCGLPSPLRQERLLLMLQGYFDDSGSDQRKEQPFVLAGYILQAEKWAKFSDDWRAECQRPPQIEYFKMFEAADASGEFASVQYDIRRYKILKLIEVIHRHELHGLCAHFKWCEWRDFSRSLRGPAKDQPYASLFFLMIDVVKMYQENLGIFPQKSQLDFDNQGKWGRFAIDWYGRMMDDSQPFCFSREYREILEGTPHQLDDKQYVPLQAADMLAWAIRRKIDDTIIGDPGLVGPDFSWVYEELYPDLWGGLGYCQESWREIRRQLNHGDPRS